jgi:hypothetical protein
MILPRRLSLVKPRLGLSRQTERRFGPSPPATAQGKP